MEIGFVSTFLPQRCGIATYTNFLATALKNAAPDLKIRIVAEREAEAKRQENFVVNPCWSREHDIAAEIAPHIEGVDIVHIQHEYAIFGYSADLVRLLEAVPKGVKKVIT
ncbi:MAG TPA: hypothetical protein ENF73_06685, partial [Proteobacteria bacterium]|nr:hypothetical protein [Pseudomonadota bacterium]